MSRCGERLPAYSIIALMFAFIGIWVWAWNARHKSAFDKLAKLPLEEGCP